MGQAIVMVITGNGDGFCALCRTCGCIPMLHVPCAGAGPTEGRTKLSRTELLPDDWLPTTATSGNWTFHSSGN